MCVTAVLLLFGTAFHWAATAEFVRPVLPNNASDINQRVQEWNTLKSFLGMTEAIGLAMSFALFVVAGWRKYRVLP
jgi:hypothetical protein